MPLRLSIFPVALLAVQEKQGTCACCFCWLAPLFALQELKKPLRVTFLSEDGRVPEEGVDQGGACTAKITPTQHEPLKPLPLHSIPLSVFPAKLLSSHGLLACLHCTAGA
jgi:hypothetical protein